MIQEDRKHRTPSWITLPLVWPTFLSLPPLIAKASPPNSPRPTTSKVNNPRPQTALDRRIPEVNFNARAVSDVLDFLQDASGTRISVDWKSLEKVGITKDSLVTAKLKDVKLSKALRLILQDVAGDKAKLAYTVDDDGIHITVDKADDEQEKK